MSRPRVPAGPGTPRALSIGPGGRTPPIRSAHRRRDELPIHITAGWISRCLPARRRPVGIPGCPATPRRRCGPSSSFPSSAEGKRGPAPRRVARCCMPAPMVLWNGRERRLRRGHLPVLPVSPAGNAGPRRFRPAACHRRGGSDALVRFFKPGDGRVGSGRCLAQAGSGVIAIGHPLPVGAFLLLALPACEILDRLPHGVRRGIAGFRFLPRPAPPTRTSFDLPAGEVPRRAMVKRYGLQSFAQSPLCSIVDAVESRVPAWDRGPGFCGRQGILADGHALGTGGIPLQTKHPRELRVSGTRPVSYRACRCRDRGRRKGPHSRAGPPCSECRAGPAHRDR